MKTGPLIDSEKINIRKELAFITTILHNSKNEALDNISLRAASLSLSAIYNGIEKILVQLLLNLGVRIKDNYSWHTEVLKKSVQENIISENTQKELAGFLSFRHFIRHAYSYEINPDTVETVIRKASEVTDIFFRELSKITDNTDSTDNQ